MAGVCYAVAILLLAWTAADLTNASLCALDNEGTAPATAGPTSPASTMDDGTTQRAPEPASPHLDDCICCSLV